MYLICIIQIKMYLLVQLLRDQIECIRTYVDFGILRNYLVSHKSGVNPVSFIKHVRQTSSSDQKQNRQSQQCVFNYSKL